MTTNRRYPDAPGTVYFFGTCLVDLFYPDAGIAAMELIRRAGIEVLYPRDQTCCGQPAWNSGFREEALGVARAQLDCFTEDYPIVVPSGSCAGMMREHYPHLFRGQPEEARAQAISDRVYELTDFLVRVLDIELRDLGEPVRVVLHTSCSARNEMGVVQEHREVLARLANVELLEPERSEECCGFGGTFAVKHPDISAVMVADKAAAAEQTGADRLLSGDCGCLMNIGGYLSRQSSDVTTQHIASFLWERTRATADR